MIIGSTARVVWFFAIFWPRQSCPVIQQLHQSESGPRYLLVVLVFWLFHLFVVLCLDKAGNQLSFCSWIYACLEPISSITTHLASNRALATFLNEVNKRSHLCPQPVEECEISKLSWNLDCGLWRLLFDWVSLPKLHSTVKHVKCLSELWFQLCKILKRTFQPMPLGEKNWRTEYQPGVNKPNISFKLSSVKVTILRLCWAPLLNAIVPPPPPPTTYGTQKTILICSTL
jgi:hypothetical protein